MKTINYVYCLLLTGLAVAGSSCGGSSATANTNVNANSSTTKIGRQPQPGSVRYNVEKLLDIAKQVRDFDTDMKGREIVVTGPVYRVSEDTVYFDAGSERKLYCTIDAANPGPFETLNKRVNDKNRYAKPIVEVVGVFKSIYDDPDKPMTMMLENCSVLSSKEPD